MRMETFSYIPDIGFVGADRFTYMATDGMGNSNVATVTVEVLASGLPPISEDGSEDDVPGDASSTDNEKMPSEQAPENDADYSTPDPAEPAPSEAVSAVARPSPGRTVSGRPSPRTEIEPVNPQPSAIPEVSIELERAAFDSSGRPKWTQTSSQSRHLANLALAVGQIIDVDLNQLVHQLDVLSDDLQQDSELRSLAVAGTVGVTTAATAGYAIWALRKWILRSYGVGVDP